MQLRRSDQIVYRDFDLNMRAHPVTGKLIIRKNDDSIKQALKNLILTNLYERPFRPSFGSNLVYTLFENYSAETESLLKSYIETAIKNYEPRIDLLQIDLIGDPDSHKLDISILFRTKILTEPTELIISIDRIR